MTFDDTQGENAHQLAVRVHNAVNELAGDKERLMQAVSQIVDEAIRSDAIESDEFLRRGGSNNWDQWVWERRGLLCHWIFCIAHDTYRLKMAKEARDWEKERNR